MSNNQPMHTNAFVMVNGIPYVLAEYLDRSTFQQIDRSFVKSEVHVDQHEAMRAVVEINVDDIGRKASDGSLNVEGNTSKHRRLVNTITQETQYPGQYIDTIRPGIVLRVNYQLENKSTGSVMRTMSEDLVIKHRGYFLDINCNDINDNAILSNFSDSMVSTITEFTHGQERMLLRINSVQMFYVVMGRNKSLFPKMQAPINRAIPYPAPQFDGTRYQYHQQNQTMQDLQYNGYNPATDVVSPNWTMFNEYYHFDNGGRDLVIHQEEVNNPNAPTGMIPCNTVRINRTFLINPGHRIVFKFCIWKNDAVVVNDCSMIASAMQVPTYNKVPDWMNPNLNMQPVPGNGEINPDHDTMIRLMHECMDNMNRQNYVINNLNTTIDYLKSIIESNSGNNSSGSNSGNGNCSCDDDMTEISDQTVQDSWNESKEPDVVVDSTDTNTDSTDSGTVNAGNSDGEKDENTNNTESDNG